MGWFDIDEPLAQAAHLLRVADGVHLLADPHPREPPHRLRRPHPVVGQLLLVPARAGGGHGGARRGGRVLVDEIDKVRRIY